MTTENNWKYTVCASKYEKSLGLDNSNDFSVTTIVHYNKTAAKILWVEGAWGRKRNNIRFK